VARLESRITLSGQGSLDTVARFPQKCLEVIDNRLTYLIKAIEESVGAESKVGLVVRKFSRHNVVIESPDLVVATCLYF
jgi:hypothetical protein